MMRNTLFLTFLIFIFPQPCAAQEMMVLPGHDEAIEWLETIDWWGEDLRGEQLKVPRTLLIAVSSKWREESPNMQVAVKKEFFYRSLLPLVVHANAMVLNRRERLAGLDELLSRDKMPKAEDLEWLGGLAVVLRIQPQEKINGISSAQEWRQVIAEALYRLDIIPAGLVLAQGASESGWGASRFVEEGNALFGQWSFDGKGLAPKKQRKELGDHRIAAFEFPFDSVRGYFLNLSSHPAYEDLRRIRAELKAAGKPVTSMALADGLLRYSERGQEYIDELKTLIRVNRFDIADTATPRDEPLGYVFLVSGEEAAIEARAKIEQQRKSGELKETLARMRLE